MLRIVGANPAMDRISTWPALRLGAVNRAGAELRRWCDEGEYEIQQ